MLKAAINDAEMPKGSRKNPLLLQGNTLQAPDRHRSMMANACVGKKNEAQKADPSHHIGGFHTPKHLKTSQNISGHLRCFPKRNSGVCCGTCRRGTHGDSRGRSFRFLGRQCEIRGLNGMKNGIISHPKSTWINYTSGNLTV